MKSVLITTFVLAVLLPATTLANSAIQDVTTSNHECQQLQTELDQVVRSGRTDVSLAASIQRMKELLSKMQAQLQSLSEADSRALQVVDTFNGDVSSVIHQMSIEHTQSTQAWVALRNEAYIDWQSKCYPELN
jgi:hypothetical protein